MESVPEGVFVVVNVPTPELFSATEPMFVAPLLNVMLPFGVPKAEVTEAEYVTDWPYIEGLSDVVTAEVVVASLLTTCVSTGDVLPAKVESPPYTAVIEYVPPDNVELEYVAEPPLRVLVASVFVPFLNVTLPVGVPEVAGAAVAVNVTSCPKFEGFSDDTTAVVVPSLFTVCIRIDDVLPMKLVSPPYVAVME